ncbi:hypothetical protein CGRA01v4_08343 [Colletotrichum graminicola]|nr:hypothetical protein CGRA01v4_08343 [Colletotrichum graminicola]
MASSVPREFPPNVRPPPPPLRIMWTEPEQNIRRPTHSRVGGRSGGPSLCERIHPGLSSLPLPSGSASSRSRGDSYPPATAPIDAPLRGRRFPSLDDDPARVSQLAG